MKSDGDLPDDPLIHVAVMGYSSDTTVLDSIITTHGLSWGLDRIVAATVNHSIWFHRPFRFDDWTLYATESPVAAGSAASRRGGSSPSRASCWPPSSRKVSSATSRRGSSGPVIPLPPNGFER